MQNDDQNDLQPGQTYSPKPTSPLGAYNTDTVTRVEAPQTAPTNSAYVSPPTVPAAPEQPLASPDENPLQQPNDEDLRQGEEQDMEEAEDAQPDPNTEVALHSWNAPEFAFTTKPAGWFFALAIFFACLIALAVLTKQWFSIGLFALMGIALAVYANRKPRTLNYTLTTHGIHVGEKSYPFDSFSAFYEVSDYGQRVFEMVPSKRLGTLVSLPVLDGDERQLEELLGSVLPKIPARNDIIDRLFRYLRF